MILLNFYNLLIISILSQTECAKILGVFHVPGRSHYLAGNTLMKILAEKGHDVTIISPFEEKTLPKNYKQVILTGLFEELQGKNLNFFGMSRIPSVLRAILFTSMKTSMSENAMKHPNFQKLMDSNEKFDVVIIEAFQSEPMMYVAHHFDAPCIVYSAQDANNWVNPFMGNPDSPAWFPTSYVSYISKDMKFFQRLYNSLVYVLDKFMIHWVVYPMGNRMLHKYYPKSPHLSDIIYNTSLVFLNSDLSIYEPIPKVPGMVNIGGFHIKNPNPLPSDLQIILNNAKNGVVYFSLGSNLKSKDIPQEKRKMILNTFSKLKQLILWKFEDENLPDKPDNVIVRKWFPQNDLLAHGKIDLFITHGGIFSTIEAVYHGVPILGIPVSSEQINNLKKAANFGYAKYVTFGDFTEEVFASYLKEMLVNSEYKSNILKRSKIMKDKQVPPADTINYWVEYVIRHGGAPHLKVTSLNLAWYQYLLLDVIAFFSVLLISTIFVAKLMYTFLFKTKMSLTTIEKKQN